MGEGTGQQARQAECPPRTYTVEAKAELSKAVSSVHHTCTRPFPAQSTKQKPTDQSIRYKTGEELVGKKQRVSGSPGISEGNRVDVNTTH